MYFSEQEKNADIASQIASNAMQRIVLFKYHRDLDMMRFYYLHDNSKGASYPAALIADREPQEVAESVIAVLTA